VEDDEAPEAAEPQMADITDRDLDLARQLPDEFVAAGHASAAQRLIEIVLENWGRFGIRQRAELVDALLPLLTPLLEPGVRVTDSVRDACRATVAKWIHAM
jgi:hypothetical protein